jgi:hypothetical protein
MQITPYNHHRSAPFLRALVASALPSLLARLEPTRLSHQPTADGGVIAKSVDGLATYSFDASGNATGQLAGLPVQSWTGSEYQYGSVEQVVATPIYTDGASFWPQVGGSPSGVATAILQCPCLLQSAATAASIISTVGTQKKYLLLVGDRGLNLGDGHNHSVGELFNLAAQTQATNLGAFGNNTVITQKVSTVADFNTALTTNGLIDGTVTFFGHGGIDSHGNYAIFVGQNPGDTNNLTIRTIGQLSNQQLGAGVTVTLNACHAGLGKGSSIAQILANQLRRTVFAYPIDMYFSASPVARRLQPGMKSPSSVPVYMVPDGDGIQPTPFKPH